jgi:hypothetical protein
MVFLTKVQNARRLHVRFSWNMSEIVVMVIFDSYKLGVVFKAVALRFGVDVSDLTFIYDGERLSRTVTTREAGIEDGGQVDVMQERRGGKPVIYIFSPTTLEALVTLSLVPEWKLSVVYPVVPMKSLGERAGEQISWRVRTKADGSLTELNTGLDVSYLFWEPE